MTSQISPIIEFYPLNFATDLNEKQNSWEAVVKIPFIDEVLNNCIDSQFIMFAINILNVLVLLIRRFCFKL